MLDPERAGGYQMVARVSVMQCWNRCVYHSCWWKGTLTSVSFVRLFWDTVSIYAPSSSGSLWPCDMYHLTQYVPPHSVHLSVTIKVEPQRERSIVKHHWNIAKPSHGNVRAWRDIDAWFGGRKPVTRVRLKRVEDTFFIQSVVMKIVPYKILSSSRVGMKRRGHGEHVLR